MKYYAFRLKPGRDLKKEKMDFTLKNDIKAGVIITCVGSLKCANIRLAEESITKRLKGKFEIVSLVGTLSQEGCHLHISIADSEGRVVGGHLQEESYIYTTAEVVIGEVCSLAFTRVYSDETGFKELCISDRDT
ncbi:PPC domain-containing DNA-binding protein [Desnuesiella massiliensis]|uniref:PPC domain-containing DNA-binding protein n=1 Tax=Desnuesiella massiliensis TaxID=1650662 RepID=UPI0006E1F637|nr:PPC domain-containing DNA-binding protein [Desnuesiella massiliensis]